jgi:hypothetical protein
MTKQNKTNKQNMNSTAQIISFLDFRKQKIGERIKIKYSKES